MTATALPYDTLVLATGARHAYFGHDEWEPFAPGLKTLEDATTLRRRILVAFERAERETDPERRAALLTFVIVGAGPTGVELAGTIAELARDTLPPDFRNIDTHEARVVLIEAGPRVLAGFPDDLSAYAQRSLESLGVEVVLGQARHRMHRSTAWSMAASRWRPKPSSGPPACAPRPPPNGSARRPTAPAACRSSPTSPCPAIPISSRSAIPSRSTAPTASRCPASRRPPSSRAATSPTPSRRGCAAKRRGPFRYQHAGSLAQIGKRKAVIDFGRFKLRGTLAWWIWGIAHIYFLIGLRNRLSVAISWLWIHARDQRAARLITQGSSKVMKVRVLFTPRTSGGG